MFYHVRIDYFDSRLKGNQTKYGFDYSTEEEIFSDVLQPYLNKKNFIFQGCAFMADEIRQVRVFQTNESIDYVVEYANAIDHNAIIPHDDESILDDAQYVTETTRQFYKKFEKKAIMSSENRNIKPKKIFISHSHKDGEFAMALVDLLHDIGFDYEEIFCSSAPACSIPEGKTIFDEIRAQFEKYDLFVIFIHSPRFYASHMSMNEMGAAWVLRTDYSSFLTKDMTTDLMKEAVVRDDRIYIQIGDKQAQYRLNELHERILKFFDKPAVKLNAWMQDSAKFLEKVENLSYPDVLPNLSMNNDEILSKDDQNRLKSWVDSGDDTMFFCEYLGGGGSVVLGDVECLLRTPREKAEWRSFFKRLQAQGLVDYMGMNGNNPVYQLTENAYKYFDE